MSFSGCDEQSDERSEHEKVWINVKALGFSPNLTLKSLLLHDSRDVEGWSVEGDSAEGLSEEEREEESPDTGALAFLPCSSLIEARERAGKLSTMPEWEEGLGIPRCGVGLGSDLAIPLLL